MNMKNKIIKWTQKEPTNREIFLVLLLILIGKWFMAPMILYMVPLSYGTTTGMSISEEQTKNISIMVTEAFIPALNTISEKGASMYGKPSGFFVSIIINTLPYFTLFWVLVICLTIIRICFGYGYRKWRKYAKPHN